MVIVPSQPFDNLLTSDVPVPAWWTSRLEQIDSFLNNRVDPLRLHTLATSPGGRRIRYVSYGQPEPSLRGRANFNSAMDGDDPDAWYRRGQRHTPVMFILAGVHGAEVEGMVGALSAIRILETGLDLTDTPQPALAAKLRRLRLIIIPVANPDGRARVPYDGWLGLPIDEMHRVGQGTRKDGTLYGWPACKLVHPMTGDVGGLGGYYDDAGVNLMNDEWSDPMSETTRVLMRLTREEAPDMVLNCHSHENVPAVLPLSYVPMTEKEDLARFAADLYRNLEQAGFSHKVIPQPQADVPPASPCGVLPSTACFTTQAPPCR